MKERAEFLKNAYGTGGFGAIRREPNIVTVTQREDKFYKPIEDGKYEPGSLGAMQCMFQAASFQETRYFIENLLEA